MKNKGQHLIEFTIIGIVVFGICIISVFFFGDKLTALFKDNGSTNIFNKNRTAIKLDTNALLSNVAIELNGKNIDSPIEAAIREKLINGSYVQTSGSSGNITETMQILQKYIEQIESLITDMPEGSQKDEFMAALNEYKKAINDYISLDSQIISGKEDPLVGLASKLDIAVNLDLEGDIAKNLNDKLQTLLSGSTDANLKKALELFSTDMLNLGASIDFKVDSRLFQNLNLQAPIDVNINERKDEISNYINKEMDNRNCIFSCRWRGNCGWNHDICQDYVNISLTLYFTDFTNDNSVNNLINAIINEQDHIPDRAEEPMLNLVNSLKNDYNESQQSIGQQLINQLSSTSSNISSEDLLKMITVYRNGTYQDIIPNTMNGESLCKSLGGTINNNNCSLP